MIWRSESKSIHEAAFILRQGGVIAFPTETVYGLGANAFNPEAVARVFEIKNRPRFDPLIVHIHDVSCLDQLWISIELRAQALIEKFWPGPLTLIYQKKERVPDIVTAGLSTVAVRMPSHPVALELIRESGVPIAAPSANPFEYLSPTSAEHVEQQIGEKVDGILDGGPCAIGLESTVLDLTGSEPVLLRPGGLAQEDIEKIIGPVSLGSLSASQPHSPGQTSRHYSPRTRLKILKKRQSLISESKKIGLLVFRDPFPWTSYERLEILSPSGDFREAASRFFSCLHRLDQAGLDIIYAEPIPEIGLGVAMMNRLRKAEK